MRVPLSDVVQPIAIPKNIPDFHQIVNILIEECHLMIRPWSRSDGIENHRSPVLRPVPKQLPSGLNVLPVKDAPRDEVHLTFEYHRLAAVVVDLDVAPLARMASLPALTYILATSAQIE